MVLLMVSVSELFCDPGVGLVLLELTVVTEVFVCDAVKRLPRFDSSNAFSASSVSVEASGVFAGNN